MNRVIRKLDLTKIKLFLFEIKYSYEYNTQLYIVYCTNV